MIISTCFFPIAVTRLLLFDSPFDGLITRLELWKQMISEQQLLVSYRDCRKQNGDLFSWSKVSDQITVDTSQLKSSAFCSGKRLASSWPLPAHTVDTLLGCSEPAAITGGIYRVSDYEVGSSVDYECNYGYEMIGASRAFCMVPSEWYPLPPTCKCKKNKHIICRLQWRSSMLLIWTDNPCTSECDVCDQKTGTCLRQQAKLNSLICDPPCEDDEACIDGQCSWTNIEPETNDHQCNPPCPFGSQCIHRQCEPLATSFCTIPCRSGQVCVDGRCGCFKGMSSDYRKGMRDGLLLSSIQVYVRTIVHVMKFVRWVNAAIIPRAVVALEANVLAERAANLTSVCAGASLVVAVHMKSVSTGNVSAKPVHVINVIMLVNPMKSA